MSVEDIKVKDCLSCPFRRCANSCFDECILIDYSSIGDRSKILDNCPLKIRSINVSLKVKNERN